MSTPARGNADTVTAALLQITQHAERLAILDERQASHYREIAKRVAELARQAADTSARVDGIHATAARQATILDALDGLDQQVAALAARLTGLTAARGTEEADERYRPAPVTQWWKLNGEERNEAISRLRAWVEQIYRPGYGHLAAALGPCWEQHPLCLYGLDWLMELWSALNLTPQRDTPALASQAEWQTRLLPALAGQMYIETTHGPVAETSHGPPSSNGRRPDRARASAPST